MISRQHRFHGFNALRGVYAKGRTVRGPLMAVKFMPDGRRSSYRAAVVVSRKIHKSAVVRNRIRRRVYEIIRRAEPQITRPFDIVLTIYSDQVATVDAGALQTAVLEQLRKAGIIRGSADKHSSPKSPWSSPKSSHDIVVPKEGPEQH